MAKKGLDISDIVINFTFKPTCHESNETMLEIIKLILRSKGKKAL